MRKIWLICMGCCSLYALAQDGQDQPGIALKSVLDSVSTRYGLSFSYVDTVVSTIRIDSIPATDSLDLLLAYIQQRALVKLEQAGEGYILIRPFAVGDSLTICGIVRDERGEGIIGATVSLAANPSVGTVVNRDGEFWLERVPFNAQVVIRSVGFRPRRMSALAMYKYSCISVTMFEAVELLDVLEVHDYLNVGVERDQNSMQIYPDELGILPGLIEPDVLQSIQQVPGVSSPYETASGIHVRGGAPDQNLVLWNGIKTYNQGHFFGMLSAFNPYITKDVKFLKKGIGPEYGDRVSGVIDINTQNEARDRLSGSAGLNMLLADANIEVPVIRDKLSVQLSARRSFTDVMKTITYNQMSKRVFQNTKIGDELPDNADLTRNDFFFKDFTTSLVWQVSEKDKIIVNTFYARDELDFSTSDDSGIQSFKDQLDTENEGYGLKWVRTFNDKLSLEWNSYLANYLLQYRFTHQNADTTEISSKKNLIGDLGTNLEIRYAWEKNTITGGIRFAHTDIQYAFEDFTDNYHLVLDQDHSFLNSYSAYSAYAYRTDRTYVSFGVRANYYAEQNQFYAEPRLYAEQEVARDLRLNVSGEYRSQPESQIKESVVSDLSLENQVWTLASDRFPIIDGYQFSLGADWRKRGWYIDVDGYHKGIDGVTTLTFGFLNPIDNEYQKGRSRVWGTDVFVKKQIKKYKTWVAYTYLRTENEFVSLNDGQPFPGNWNIEHAVNWSHFYNWKDFQFSLGWQWHTGKAFTYVEAVDLEGGPVSVAYDGINAQNLPVYHRLDFSMLYDFYIGNNRYVNYRIGLSVLNLYNRRNILNREFRTTPALDNELIDTRIYSLGITPNLVFRVFW